MEKERIAFDFDIWWLELDLPEWFHIDDLGWWYLENKEWTFGIYILWVDFWEELDINTVIKTSKNVLDSFKSSLTWTWSWEEKEILDWNISNFILDGMSISQNYWVINHIISSNKWFIKISFHDYDCENIQNAQKIHDEVLSNSNIYFK